MIIDHGPRLVWAPCGQRQLSRAIESARRSESSGCEQPLPHVGERAAPAAALLVDLTSGVPAKRDYAPDE